MTIYSLDVLLRWMVFELSFKELLLCENSHSVFILLIILLLKLYLLKKKMLFISFWASLVPQRTSLMAQMIKHVSTMQETWVRSLSREDPLEKEKAIHSSTLAWKVPWMGETGRLQSIRWQRVAHD